GRAVGGGGGGGDVGVGLAGADEVEGRVEAGLGRAVLGPGTAEVIEHDREGELLDVRLESRDHVRTGVELDVPVAVADLFGGDVERTLRAFRIDLAVRRGVEIETDAAHAGGRHVAEGRPGPTLADNPDASGAAAER